ncbi:hypothetical protein [Aerolutibacter ruishenii]|uniref:hypothetical protein n=1 Tax=Aerolutibacter ruishenii TaxID=686800 RepID=UPI0011A68222|nr:hypothetical protein [Lysobacter ruishenii]
MLVGGLCVLGVATLGWMLAPPQADAVAPAPSATVATISASTAPDAVSDTATLLDASAGSVTAVANPFGPPADAPTESTQTVVASASNPFSALEPAPHEETHPAATAAVAAVSAPSRGTATATATAKTTAAPGTPTRVAPEPDLLQALMQNIRQPAEPVRDTRAMDRLARRLDRQPMPATAGPKDDGNSTQPATAPAPAPAPATLRAELDQ